MDLRCDHGGPYRLDIQAGECVAVVGRSGSGKSVLLRLIADLDPHEGEVALHGRLRSTWAAPEWRAQVVYQAAEPAWWAATAGEHMNGATAEVLAPWLARLGLDAELLDADVTRLSTGERQRMALVRSLSRQPRVLLLDEPTASLDAASALAVEQLVAEKMQRDGLVVVLVTHAREQADRLGHRVLQVRDRGLHPA
ncbi:MAG: hypothetical protein JWP29_4170 [Rhodoferax sp.]|nr:hypothetical protein [Rhodoferax sp.]